MRYLPFLCLLASFVTKANMPVIDVANLEQQIVQAQHMLREIETLKQQLDAAKDNLHSINGVRHMSGVIDSIYDITVKVDPNLTLKKQGLHNSQSLKLGGEFAGLFDDVNRYRGRWFRQTQVSLQQTQTRYNQLLRLIRRIDNAPQQKDIQDLHARINAEGVMLANEQAKLQLLSAQAKANDALAKQRITQMAVESAGELHPINWK